MFNSSGVKLLLVLAEPVLADLTTFRLELLGYQVETVGCGSDANASIAKEIPDLVIVDTSIRDGDGLEWVARLRGEHSAVTLPVLVFSLDTSLETVERSYHAGAQDYLISPFDPIVMEEKIEKMVVGRLSNRKKRPTADAAAAVNSKRNRSSGVHPMVEPVMIAQTHKSGVAS